MPSDPAIPARAILGRHHFTRRFVPDKQLLLREAKPTAEWLSWVAYAVVLAIATFLAAAVVWGLGKLGGYSSSKSAAFRASHISMRSSA
jgi:hypothetical protein